MPFEDKEYKPKAGLKEVAGQKSMFDGKPKPLTQQAFEQKVQAVQDKQSSYQKRTYELALKFIKIIEDKTLPQNKNVFNREAEKELLQNMVGLAREVNNDTSEIDAEGEGSLSWIILLLKTCFSQRDRINELEYALLDVQKRTAPSIIADLVKKEIASVLDSQSKK